jgi:hypothetical protein
VEGVLGADADGGGTLVGVEGEESKLGELVGPFKSDIDLRLLFLSDARLPEGGEAETGGEDTATVGVWTGIAVGAAGVGCGGAAFRLITRTGESCMSDGIDSIAAWSSFCWVGRSPRM